MILCPICQEHPAEEGSICDSCLTVQLERKRATVIAQVEHSNRPAELSPAQKRAKALAAEMNEKRFNAAFSADNGSDHGNNSTGVADLKGPMKTLGLDE